MLEHENEVTCSNCSEKISILGKHPFSMDKCSNCGHEFQVPIFIDHFRLDNVVRDDGVFIEFNAYDTLLNRNVLLKKLHKAFSPKDSEPAISIY